MLRVLGLAASILASSPPSSARGEGAIFHRIGRRQQFGQRLSPPAVLDRVRYYAKLAGLAYGVLARAGQITVVSCEAAGRCSARP